MGQYERTRTIRPAGVMATASRLLSLRLFSTLLKMAPKQRGGVNADRVSFPVAV